MSNTCILVLSIGRSGSSATAGMLHTLGVNMGVEFLNADKNNPLGTFEDLAFVNLNRAILTGQAGVSEFSGMVRDEPLWGIKDPQLALTVGHLIPRLYESGTNVKIVLVTRNKEDAMNSYHKAYYHGSEISDIWYDKTSFALNANIERFKEKYNGDVLEIKWEDVLASPLTAAEKLAKFINVADRELIKKAAAMIKPKEPVVGWGRIALGVRIASTPEPWFFNSWTKLLTGGLRAGDKVLLPESYLPAHHASNNLAKSFLATTCDSLLLIDDDMTFEGDALEALRSNKDNWDYDIVSAFATTRRYPPKPIIMRLQDPQPEEPEILKGDTFDLVKDFNDGDLEPVDAVGLAFTLIKRHVFEKMLDEKYGVKYSWFFSYGRGLESDDIEFSRRARELGLTMAVDTAVKLGHVGRVVYGLEDYLEWKAERDEFLGGKNERT